MAHRPSCALMEPSVVKLMSQIAIGKDAVWLLYCSIWAVDTRMKQIDGIGKQLRIKRDRKLFRWYTHNAKTLLNALKFADDAALLATSWSGAQKALQEYNHVAANLGHPWPDHQCTHVRKANGDWWRGYVEEYTSPKHLVEEKVEMCPCSPALRKDIRRLNSLHHRCIHTTLCISRR